MSLRRARHLADALGRWAHDDWGYGPENLRQAINTAGYLLADLMELERRAGQWPWTLPGRPFACTGGHCLHTRDCSIVHQSADLTMAAPARPLTSAEAQEWLRESPERRRCTVCRPDIPEAPWVRVRSAGGQIRWRLDGEETPQ